MISFNPKSRIAGTGKAVPERILTNADLEKIVETSDDWIVERTGIRERHIAEKGSATSDLCVEASRIALDTAGIEAEELDAIIVGTVTGDMKFPSTACFVQDKLNAKNAFAFDISAACSGFLYSLSIADTFISNGKYDKILIIGAEILTSMVDFEDRNTCVLFGDGAGAAVITSSDNGSGILYNMLKSDGSLTHLLKSPGGGSINPANSETIDKRLHFIQMEGRKVFKYAVRSMSHAVLKALDDTGVTPDELKLFIPHQANTRILESVAEKAGIPRDKVMVNVDRYGNTSAASIPIALDEAIREGRLETGDLCLLAVFGGGFTWGSALVRI